jgi:hypothetical protein
LQRQEFWGQKRASQLGVREEGRASYDWSTPQEKWGSTGQFGRLSRILIQTDFKSSLLQKVCCHVFDVIFIISGYLYKYHLDDSCAGICLRTSFSHRNNFESLASNCKPFRFKPSTHHYQYIMSRAILITGATGKQGGAVIKALLASKSDFQLLAVTRDINSSSARRLLATSPQVSLVQGDLDDTDSIFKSANQASSLPIWGVFSVQTVSISLCGKPVCMLSQNIGARRG